MTIVLVGAHGVGKSTTCRALAARLGYAFDGEIGAELAADTRWRAPSTAADRSQRAFDAEVFRRELERDAGRHPDEQRVVESWHPGNLAYAHQRSPGVAREALPRVRAATAGRFAIAVPLLAPPEVLRERATEPGDPGFFDAVGHAAAVWAGRLGLHVTRPVWTHRSSPDAVVDEILSLLLETRWNESS